MSAAVWTLYNLDSAKRQLHNVLLSKPLYIVTSQRRIQGYYTYNVPNVGAISSIRWIKPDRVSCVLEMVQNSFLRIKYHKTCLLWVIIDFRGNPHPFSSIPRDVVSVLIMIIIMKIIIIVIIKTTHIALIRHVLSTLRK